MKFNNSKLIVCCSLLLAYCLLFIACNSLKITGPTNEVKVTNIELVSSMINIPVELDIKDIETKINKELQGLIYEDNSLEDNNNDNVMVKAWKKENITISMISNELQYRVPLKLWIKAGIKFEKFGIKLSDYREINAEIALKYKTMFSVNKDWTLTTKTTSNGYDWISTPTIKIANIDVPIRFIADIILKASEKKISTEIDKSVNKNLDLRKRIDEIWSVLQNPYKVNDEFNVWLKITPIEILTQPINGFNNKIKLAVGIKSVNEVFVGKDNDLSYTYVPLPDLKIQNNIDPGFVLNLNTEISFDKVNDLAKKELIGKIFTQGKRKIEIQKINIYPSIDKFVVEVNVTGSLNGTVFLTGKPVYNSEKRAIEIKEMDFDINTQNKLVKSANWLLHGSFVKLIEPKLIYTVADKLDEYKLIVQQYIKENKSIKGMTIRGELKNIDINKIFITEKSIVAIILIEGQITLIVDGLSKI